MQLNDQRTISTDWDVTRAGSTASSRSTAHRRRAQGLAEFALILPVFALLVMSVVDFGRAFASYEAVANAAREGARYCALKLTTPGLTQRVTDELNGTVSGISVSPSNCPTNTAVGDPVTITVSTPFTPVTPLMQTVVGSSLTLSASATMMMTQ